MGLIGSIKNSVTSAVNTATKTVSAKATAAVKTLNTMKKVALDTTKKAMDKGTSAVYYAAKTVKKYAVVPYEVAHTAASGLSKLGHATGKIAKVLGHKALHAAHHAGHVLHHKVEAVGGVAQKATVAALKKLAPAAAGAKIAAFGSKFLKATVLAPVLSGIKTAYAVKTAIAASMDPKVSSEDTKKLWIKAGVSAAETALNASVRFSPVGLAVAVVDIGLSVHGKYDGVGGLVADTAMKAFG